MSWTSYEASDPLGSFKQSKESTNDAPGARARYAFSSCERSSIRLRSLSCKHTNQHERHPEIHKDSRAIGVQKSTIISSLRFCLLRANALARSS